MEERDECEGMYQGEGKGIKGIKGRKGQGV